MHGGCSGWLAQALTPRRFAGTMATTATVALPERGSSVISDARLNKLWQVASLYYEKHLTQEEIASIVGVSRPMISRMLADAQSNGIVEITVKEPVYLAGGYKETLKKVYGLASVQGVRIDRQGDPEGNRKIAQVCCEYLFSLTGVKNIGIGWAAWWAILFPT